MQLRNQFSNFVLFECCIYWKFVILINVNVRTWQKSPVRFLALSNTKINQFAATTMFSTAPHNQSTSSISFQSDQLQADAFVTHTNHAVCQKVSLSEIECQLGLLGSSWRPQPTTVKGYTQFARGFSAVWTRLKIFKGFFTRALTINITSNSY